MFVHRLVSSGQASDHFLMANLHVSTVVSSSLSSTLVYDFKSLDQIEALLLSAEGSKISNVIPEHITVADGGAKRGVMRSRSSFLPESIDTPMQRQNQGRARRSFYP